MYNIIVVTLVFVKINKNKDSDLIWRRCWKVGQIVIEERWRQSSFLHHSCFHLSALRFSLTKMNFGSSVLHIVVEPAKDCCRYLNLVVSGER